MSSEPSEMYGAFQTLSNAICKPFSNAYNNDVSGGLYSTQEISDFAFNQRGPEIYRPSDSSSVLKNFSNLFPAPEPVIYAGPLHHHFGHFFAESVHRLWFAISESPESDIVFCTREGGLGLTRWAAEFLGAFGLLDRTRVVHAPQKFLTVFVPEPGKILGQPERSWYSRWLNEKNPLSYSRKQTSKPKKIAVTRAHFPTGRLIGESEIELALEKNGFFILRPEKYSVADQIDFYLNAEKIVFTEGSAFHILEILPDLNVDIVVLSRRYFGERLAKHSLSKRVKSLSVFRDIVSLPPVMNDGKFLAPAWCLPDAAINFLFEKGFITQKYHRNDDIIPILIRDFCSFIEARMKHKRFDFRAADIVHEAVRMLTDGCRAHEMKFGSPTGMFQALISAREALAELNSRR